MKNYKIAVAGTGYVGLSLGVLLSQHHQVVAVDIVQAKVDMINNKKSPIQDDYIEKYLAEKDLNLTATLDAKVAYSDADFVVIAAPTNYDSKTQHFDTSAVEAVIKLVMEYCPLYHYITRSDSLTNQSFKEKNWKLLESYRNIIKFCGLQKDKELDVLLNENYLNHEITILKKMKFSKTPVDREKMQWLKEKVKSEIRSIWCAHNISLKRKLMAIYLSF